MANFKEFLAMNQFKTGEITENQLVGAYSVYKTEIEAEVMQPAIETARQAKAAYINVIQALKSLETEYDKLADVIEMKSIADRRRGYKDSGATRTFNYQHFNSDIDFTDDEIFKLRK